MSVIKRFALGVGASLIGSSLTMILGGLLDGGNNAQLGSFRLSWIVLMIGLLVVFYASGLMEDLLVRPLLVIHRRIFPTIAVISDLDWNVKGTHAWTWERMTPEEWISRIGRKSQKSDANLSVRLVRISQRRVRWFLDGYAAILNPYGSVYPEIDVKRLVMWSRIRDYVLRGGTFVNVADIPFYFAYDRNRRIRYDTGKNVYQYVAPTVIPQMEDQNKIHLLTLKGGFQSYIPFSETPFPVEVKVGVINTERVPQMLDYVLTVKSEFGSVDLKSVAINRMVISSTVDEYGIRRDVSNVRSIVDEIEIGKSSSDQTFGSPICFIDFGKGTFLVSLLFLGERRQSDSICENTVELQSHLIVEEAEKFSWILLSKRKLKRCHGMVTRVVKNLRSTAK